MGKINMKFATVLLLALLAIFAVVESSRLRKRPHHHGHGHGRRSDIQLKTDLKMISTLPNGVEVYSWTWNKIAEAKGLSGKSVGVIAQQVQNIVPGSVSRGTDGFMKVDYSLIFTQ